MMYKKIVSEISRLQRRFLKEVYGFRLRRIFPDRTLVALTFDTEEDWDLPNGMLYYNSYKYITSGALNKLAQCLRDRSISATFYVTPNLVRDMPEVPKRLELMGHTIGVHLHVHNFKETRYPYFVPPEDRMVEQSFDRKLKYIRLAKCKIEQAVGHEVPIFRSGHSSCDPETEKAVKLVGFKAISVYQGVFFIHAKKLWNLGNGGGFCLFDYRKSDRIQRYIDKRSDVLIKGDILVFLAHPMSLYNYSEDKICSKKLDVFAAFLDTLISDDTVQFVNQYRLLQLLERRLGCPCKEFV